MKVICPFCKSELTGPDVPTESVTFNGTDKITYICHKKICYNKDKHPNHDNVVVVFKPEEEDEIQSVE